MAQAVTGGYGAYCNYGYEATYASAATGTRVFGHGTKLTISRKNSMERVHSLGYRNAQANVAKKYEGSASLDFNMSNGSFLRAVLGAVADAGVGPYTHTYSETDAIPSFSIVNGVELGTNDYVSVLTGCKVNSCTISAAVDETVKVKLDCLYKTETLATSGIGSQVAETEDLFTFAHGTLSLGGSTVGNVQSVELTINHNLEMVWGLGSRLATTGIGKTRTYDLKMTVAFSQNTDLLTKMLGSTSAPLAGTPASVACVLTFTNSGAGTAERSVVATFANVYLNEETLPLDVNEVIKEDVTGWALSCTNVVYTNNTAVDAGNP